MKQGIHPDYHPVVFQDASTGYKFLSGSTVTSSETIKWEDGNEYPFRWCCGQVQQEVRSQVRHTLFFKKALGVPNVFFSLKLLIGLTKVTQR